LRVKHSRGRRRGGGTGHRAALLGLLALAVSLSAATSASAAAPVLGESWVDDVSSGSVTFHGSVNPNGLATTYRFEYLTDAAYQSNVGGGKDPFAEAARAPAGGSASAGSGSSYVAVSQHASALKPGTTYHYRLAASNSSGSTFGEPHTFTTQEIGGGFQLPDSRGWEMVSPIDKNGGAIQAAGKIHGGGVLQAAAGGGAVTYTSASSFGEEAEGAPPGSQYISRHTEAGWSTIDISTPLESGSYGNEPNGVPYQLFSGDLARAIMLNGIHCRGEGTDCPVANPPLPGTEAPDGYQNYYLRDNEDGSFTAVLTEANGSSLTLSPEEFNLHFAGSSPDLRHPVFSSCAKLTANATEVPGPEGCEAAETNLYEWSAGQFQLINVLPGESHGTPGALLAAQGASVSADGSRVYFTELEDGPLYLHESGKETKLLPESEGGGAAFQTATPDGAIAYFTRGSTLYRYVAGGNASESIATEVIGVLGASADGSHVYYAKPSGVYLWNAGTTTKVAEAAQESDYPPTTGTARVSSDGSKLLFLSAAPLTGYDNLDAASGEPDSELFLYDAAAHQLSCLSCNPTNGRPAGPSTIPGSRPNGIGTTDVYKPRALSSDGRRVFFESTDALVALDTNQESDVYQWEANGGGSCQSTGGCVSLISNGKDPEGASFVDASSDGSDAYFLTYESLATKDPGSADVYDARVGGGEPVSTKPIECEGDACAPLPQPPEDPTIGTLIPSLGNPPVHFPSAPKSCPKGKRQVIRHGHTACVRRHWKPKRHHKRGRR
jgi:hypothetical protein